MTAKLTALLLASLIASLFIVNAQAQQNPNQTLKANFTQTNVTLSGNLSALQADTNTNTTTAFDKLENSTAILQQRLDVAENANGDENTTIRADIKESVSDILNSLGQIGPKIREATSEHLQSLRTSAETLLDAIQRIVPGGQD